MKFKTGTELTAAILISAGFAFAALAALPVFGLWHQIDHRAMDALRRTAVRYGYGPEATSAICYLTISDQTYEAFNRGSLDRRKLARANRVLQKAGAQAVLYDLIFARPTRPASDEEFARSIRENGRVFLPTGFALRASLNPAADGALPETGNEIAQMAEFAAAARGSGHVSAPAEADGVYRKFFLAVRRGQELVPSLALAAFLDYAGLTMADVRIEPGAFATIYGSRSQSIGRDLYVPVDESGRAWIPYTGPWASDFEKMSLHHLLEAADSEEKEGNLLNFFEGRFVFVGDVSTGIADAGATPLENDVPLVAIHAALLNALLKGEFIDFWRPGATSLLLAVLFVWTGAASCLQKGRFLHAAAAVAVILLAVLWIEEFVRMHFFPVVTAGTLFLFAYAGTAISMQFREYRNGLRIRQENAVLHRELDIAARIQRQYLPQTLPDRRDIEIAPVNIQALNVGGDFYDVLEFSSGRIGILLGDVSGKGIPAALHMSAIMSSFRSIASTAGSESPRDLLLMLNDVLYRYSTRAVSAFATAVLVVIDPAARQMTVARCGHELPLLWHPDTRQIRELKPPGSMLGIRPTREIQNLVREETVALAPGEVLCLYSDGISEAADRAGEFFGVHRLKESLRTYGGGPAGEILDAVLSDVQLFCQGAPQHDDITLLFARIKSA